MEYSTRNIDHLSKEDLGFSKADTTLLHSPIARAIQDQHGKPSQLCPFRQSGSGAFTFANMMKRAAYADRIVGKWQFDPACHVFDAKHKPYDDGRFAALDKLAAERPKSSGTRPVCKYARFH